MVRARARVGMRIAGLAMFGPMQFINNRTGTNTFNKRHEHGAFTASTELLGTSFSPLELKAMAKNKQSEKNIQVLKVSFMQCMHSSVCMYV